LKTTDAGTFELVLILHKFRQTNLVSPQMLQPSVGELHFPEMETNARRQFQLIIAPFGFVNTAVRLLSLIQLT